MYILNAKKLGAFEFLSQNMYKQYVFYFPNDIINSNYFYFT